MNDHVALALNDTNFRTEVLESSVPVLVDFWAPWCPPCQKLAPTIEELTYQYSESARVGKIDVDVNPESASTYRITSIPGRPDLQRQTGSGPYYRPPVTSSLRTGFAAGRCWRLSDAGYSIAV